MTLILMILLEHRTLGDAAISSSDGRHIAVRIRLGYFILFYFFWFLVSNHVANNGSRDKQEN